MDASTLSALQEALRLSPDNLPLRVTVMLGLRDAGQAGAALEHARLLAPRAAELTPEQALAAAQVLMDGGEQAAALPLLERSGAGAGVARARALLALGRREEARAVYEAAVAANAALQDRGLESELSGKVLSLAAARAQAQGEERVKSVANDDTTADVTRILHPAAERILFADVGGLDEVKQQIRRRIITPFQKPSLFARFRRQAGGGILMYGPPGCGKTLLARATAGECGAKFYNVAISDVLDMYIGESERKLHAVFEQARRTAPSVLFFDEVEALGGKRAHHREGTSSKLVSQFLAELDGFAQDNQGVLVLAASNVPWSVDPAFRRPGRFDRVLFVPPPDKAARESILAGLLKDRPQEPGIDAAALAGKTGGFSGADLKNLVETAVDAAIEQSIERGAEVPLSGAHLAQALREVKPTTLEWLTTARNYARYANEGGQYDDVLAFLNRHTSA